MISANGQWRAIDDVQPLTNAVRVQRDDTGITGWARVYIVNDVPVLGGPVFRGNPDTNDHEGTVQIGHTGIAVSRLDRRQKKPAGRHAAKRKRR